MKPTFKHIREKSIPYSRKSGKLVCREEDKNLAMKKKSKKFSVTKAVKSNARDMVGQPRPAKVIDDRARDEKRKARHKTTLSELLTHKEE